MLRPNHLKSPQLFNIGVSRCLDQITSNHLNFSTQGYRDALTKSPQLFNIGVSSCIDQITSTFQYKGIEMLRPNHLNFSIQGCRDALTKPPQFTSTFDQTFRGIDHYCQKICCFILDKNLDTGCSGIMTPLVALEIGSVCGNHIPEFDLPTVKKLTASSCANTSWLKVKEKANSQKIANCTL